MSRLTQTPYVRQLSHSLVLFKEVGHGGSLFVFRCPFCGDSQKSATKRRGYLVYYDKEHSFFFKCHNCSLAMNFDTFLQKISPPLYNDYCFEKFKDKTAAVDVFDYKPPKEVVNYNKYLKMFNHIRCLNTLNADHMAREYVDHRQIPNQFHKVLYYTSNFYAWINEVMPEQFVGCNKDPDIDPRLVIPFFDVNRKLFAVQGRTLINSEMRYITIKFAEDMPKLFGQERCDFTQKHYVLEGPIDSLFIPNALAMAGTDLDLSLFSKQRAVFVLDNEPRNVEVCKRYKKIIDADYKLCIWPSSIKSKDVNDMIVMEDLTATTVRAMIDQSTCSGIEALLKFQDWKRC